MIRNAVEAGAKGLWIEKAIACSAREASEIERVVSASGAAAIVDHPRRAQAAYRGVKRVIDAATLGELQTINCLMSGLARPHR